MIRIEEKRMHLFEKIEQSEIYKISYNSSLSATTRITTGGIVGQLERGDIVICLQKYDFMKSSKILVFSKMGIGYVSYLQLESFE